MALSKRLISALIAFSMSATIATTAFAQTDNSITLNEEQNQLQTVEPSQEEKISIEYASIPEQLDVEELKAQGFSTRVKSEETDLSDIVLEKMMERERSIFSIHLLSIYQMTGTLLINQTRL